MCLLKISDMPPAVQGKEIFKLQPFLTGLSSSLSSVAGACKSLCSPAEGPGVLLPPCAPLIHVQICSWRPWTLQRSSYWQLCLGLTKDVPLFSLTVLQMVSQDCIEEHKSWVKAFLKKSITVINVLLVLFWKCCFTSSEASAGGFPTEWGFPMFCQVPVPRVAPPSCCQPVPAWCCSQGLHVLHCYLIHLLREPLWCMGSNLEILILKKIRIKSILLILQISIQLLASLAFNYKYWINTY